MTENVVCYGCKYAPIELLAGFGADARLIMAEPESFEVAERLAHGNLCGFGKSVLACGLDPNVHQMVLTTCCDVMRRAYDVLKAQGCLDFLWMVDLPHRTGAPERRLLQAQLRSLARAYARFSGRSFEVGRALAAIQVPPAPKPGSVALVGAHAPQSLLDELDRGIGAPVVNHTCTGERILAQPPIELARAESAGCGRCTTADIAGEGTNASTFDRFVEWYAGALLDQTPCMRMDEVGGRSGLVSGAHQGVVYHTMKFCDYYGFEYADVAGTTATPIRDRRHPPERGPAPHPHRGLRRDPAHGRRSGRSRRIGRGPRRHVLLAQRRRGREGRAPRARDPNPEGGPHGLHARRAALRAGRGLRIHQHGRRRDGA